MKTFEFASGEEMLDTLQRGMDLYSPSQEMYVFLYNEAGGIAHYSIDERVAIHLERLARQHNEYWAAFLGVGGHIWDDPGDKYNKPNPGCSNIDFCNEWYGVDWINTLDVLKYFGQEDDYDE